MTCSPFFHRNRAGFAFFPAEDGGGLVFHSPREILLAETPAQVREVLGAVDAATRDGRCAAGFVAYEAAPGMDPALTVRTGPAPHPLAGFFLYEEGVRVSPGEMPLPRPEEAAFGEWRPAVPREDYEAALSAIRGYIAAGDTYQINHTFPLEAPFRGEPFAAFLALLANQPAGEGGFLRFGGFAVLSLSPELFFSLDGGRLETKPMKGTAPRGRWAEEDAERAKALVESQKERAENVMIVDLLRNDMGRVSAGGSVRVERLFEAERYPTLWQMTSTIVSETRAPLGEIFAGLFPSGSVTGAPKVRSMQIIRELESSLRGIYCGAVGRAGPGRRARFNVAIRTVVLDCAPGTARYSVGSGVTWDSRTDAEYAECLLKAEVLLRSPEAFSLLETLLWDGREFFLLEGHLDRMGASAGYFGFPMDRAAAARTLRGAVEGRSGEPVRVRLTLDGTGCLCAETGPVTLWPDPVRLALAPGPVDDMDAFLFHKTTRRAVYDRARAACPEADEAVLWNARGEITETCVANIAIKTGDGWVTPPVSCGLLPGVFRRHLLDSGRLREGGITREDLAAAAEIAVFNAVRGWAAAEWRR
ncbi:MAG: aminodeoxychorismate synthase component I [Candidatus Hydrogenedentes bacterium]|nr:aminodeoxychorismate synthase component I [Candidatus Hydrogenedentota bacterium]